MQQRLFLGRDRSETVPMPALGIFGITVLQQDTKGVMKENLERCYSMMCQLPRSRERRLLVEKKAQASVSETSSGL